MSRKTTTSAIRIFFMVNYNFQSRSQIRQLKQRIEKQSIDEIVSFLYDWNLFDRPYNQNRNDYLVKGMQIDLSTLSEAQKKIYVQLLAQSNLQFTKQDNQFVAQFKVNPNNLNSPHPSPQPQQRPTALTPHSTNRPKVKPDSKRSEGVHIPNKKALGKVVKLGELTKLEQLHPFTQIYVYPKRMSVGQLFQTVEVVYQKFWQEHKNRNSHIRSINLTEWVYRRVLCSQKDKLKIQQKLLNLIDSLNHYKNKHPSLQLFYNFMSERYPIDSFFYFLVLRGLLEQLINDKILEKSISNQSNRGLLGYKLRSNPHEKNIYEDDVSSFLDMLDSEGFFSSKNHPKTLENIFEGVTKKMYFDESRRKNYISFYELLDFLVEDFIESDVSSCDMSLSKTELGNEDDSLSELITDEVSNHEHLQKGTKAFSKKQETYSCSVSLEPLDEELFIQRQTQEGKQTLKQELRTMILDRANEIYSKLGMSMSEEALEVIMVAFETVTELDKHKWISFRGSVNDPELLAIEKLQEMYRHRDEPYLLTKIVKNLFLLPVIRQTITKDISL